MDQLKYIIVSADNDIAEETLKKYFQSPESQGGEVLRVLIRHDGSFKVKFRHEEGQYQYSKSEYWHTQKYLVLILNGEISMSINILFKYFHVFFHILISKYILIHKLLFLGFNATPPLIYVIN